MIYVVKQGDTLLSISAQTGVPVWKMVYDNQLASQDQLVIGQALLILQPEESASMRGDMLVTGDVYKRQSLPWSLHLPGPSGKKKKRQGRR